MSEIWGPDEAEMSIQQCCERETRAARLPIQERWMITIIFLGFVGMFAIAGTFISIEAKRRSDASRQRANSPHSDKPFMGRATADHDERDLAA